ncbi:MAG: hypothetical protein PF503_21195 [Desulfobacula sp.]|jgi:signal transduction histidine kinase|nr:hypothetical protein [Desulfobacula sp.]
MDDNGQLTVSCENLEKIFDPYFSTKGMGADKGQGLGLTISYSIINKHGGLINVEAKLETGSLTKPTTRDELSKVINEVVSRGQ